MGGGPRRCYATVVSLAPNDLVAAAADVIRAVGEPRTFEPPRDARAAARVVDAVRAALVHGSDARGLEMGPVIDQLEEERRRRWSDAARARRLVAELQALFDQVAFRRTKRAERGRTFAQLMALLELEPALGVAPSKEGDDAEQHLKRIRRTLRATR